VRATGIAALSLQAALPLRPLLGEVAMAQSYPSPPPPRLRPDWSSWIVIAAVLLMLVVFGLYFYAG
jgi:hypothetical protein